MVCIDYIHTREGASLYQALIVDDEKEIRDGLVSWPWEELGIQMAGCCAHGLEALQFIAEQPVDIVIADIRMPFMDGLELMEALERHYPFIHVVILSGYSDFQYAQKAIQQGAVDYLLKPVDFPTLSASVMRLVNRLNEQKQADHRMAVLNRKESQLAKVLRNDFLDRLFHMPLSQYDLEQSSAEGEVMLEGDSYTAAIVRLDRLSLQQTSVSGWEMNLIVFSLDNIFSDIWDTQGYGYHMVRKDAADIYLLSKVGGEPQLFQNIIQQLLRYMGLFKSTFSVAIGSTVQEPTDIHKSAHSARKTLDKSPENSVIVSHENEEQETEPDELSAHKDNNFILLNAKRYLQQNYNRSITLKEVADHVYVSPGHLSYLFKDSNETFLKYLTTIRINKAKELMVNSSYKIYEIVEMVGYSDPAYFSEVFKKNTGKTPNEYRNSLRPS